MEKVTSNSTVSVHYTGRLEDGTVFDSSLVEGREPLTATLGQGQLIPGFENGLIGMSVGDTKTVEIEPEACRFLFYLLQELFVDIPLTPFVFSEMHR